MASIANVILQIGSRFGPGGLASVQAGIQMLGGFVSAVGATIEKADKMSLALKNTNIDVVEFQKSVKGAVSNMDAMAAAFNLKKAGVQATGKELGQLAALADQMADATGGNATEEFNKLVDSIARGNARALKPLGIELKNNTTLAEAQAEAFRKVLDKSSGMQVNIETVTDAVDSLKASYELLTAEIYKQAMESEGFWATLTSGVTDYMNTVTKAMQLTNSIFFFLDSNLDTMYAKVAAAEYIRAQKTRQTTAILAEAGAFSEADISQALGEDMTWQTTSKETKWTAGYGGKAPKAGVGGGAGKSTTAAGEDEFEKQMRLLNRAEDLQEQNEAQQKENEQKLENAQKGYEGVTELNAKYNEQIREQNQWLRDNERDAEVAALQERAALYEEYTKRKWLFAQQFTGNLATLMLAENEKAFNVGKAAAYAETVVNTAAASMAAYKSAASIPYAGFILGPLAAAAAIAAGAVQLGIISRTKYNPGAAGGGAMESGVSVAGGAGGGVSTGGSSLPYHGGGSGQERQPIVIYMNSDARRMFSIMQDENRSSVRNGEPSFQVVR